MTSEPFAKNSDPREAPLVDPALRARALAKYQLNADQYPEMHADLTLEEVRQSIHELRVHKIELQMQNDELRQSQIALEESRTRFRDLYDNAPVGYCLVREDGQMDDANQTLCEMLGYAPEFLNRQKLTSLINRDDQDAFYHLRRRILASGRSQTCEVRLLKNDKSYAWIELSVKIASIDEDRVCLRVALINIDARVQAEAASALLENQLRESQKMEAIGTLAGGIAHDFNNILAVILANTEMTERLTKMEAPTVLPFVHEVKKAAIRARELVNQILAFCRRQPINRHVVSLADVIEESIGMLRATLPARFQLEFTSCAAKPNVFADETQIEQVVINLATNAMQSMDSKPGHFRIHLDTILLQEETIRSLHLNKELWSAHKSAVRVTFSDDGPGMDPSVVDRIFEPFYTTKPVNQGTGLGLAVVHGIVRAHDGQIFVDTIPDQGTVFTIYLPPARISSAESDDTQSSSPKESLLEPDRNLSSPVEKVSRNVVYVDDDTYVLNAIVHLLGHYDVVVRGYSDPSAALQYLRDQSNAVEVVVTDYNMPGISGLEFARQIHSIRPGLPVVVTSGYIDEELRSHAAQSGVTVLLPKPFSATVFLEMLKQLGPSV